MHEADQNSHFSVAYYFLMSEYIIAKPQEDINMAILQSARIRNFRNVADKELTLLGSNIISGPNMTGKTNTLNAIHWAFTGVDMEGSNDNRANFPLTGETKTSVLLTFDTFTFERVCEMANDSPSVSIFVDGEQAKTTKAGEGILYAKLGLADFVLTQPKGFDIVRFLLNPLYFDTIAPGALRKFFYKQASLDFAAIAEQQTNPVKAMLERNNTLDPYKLSETITKAKKAKDGEIKICKAAAAMFPSIEKEAADKEKALTKELKTLETDEALADKYALAVSKRINKYYENVMGIKVCLLEKGVGDDVYKDVCYPILPKSDLPFSAGSQAERTFVGLKFINEVCLTWNIKPLVVLIDNMESLDEFTTKYVNDLGVQYVGALVK